MEHSKVSPLTQQVSAHDEDLSKSGNVREANMASVALGTFYI